MKKVSILIGLMLVALPIYAKDLAEQYGKIAYEFKYRQPVCTPLASACESVHHYINMPGHIVSYPCYTGQTVGVENRTASNLHLDFNVCVNDKVVTVRPGVVLRFVGVRRGDKLIWAAEK